MTIRPFWNSKVVHTSYLIQSARKRAHLCAILRPASKKHIWTISVSRVLVFASRPARPSLKLKTVWAFCYKNITEEVVCILICCFVTSRSHWRKPQPASTGCLKWGSERAQRWGCPQCADRERPAASHESLETAALQIFEPWNITTSISVGLTGKHFQLKWEYIVIMWPVCYKKQNYVANN